MKSFIITALIIAASTFAHAAVGFTPAGSVIVTGVEAEKSQLAFEELPEGVIRTLDGARFTGWKPVVAYKVKGEITDYYEITSVRGEEIETLMLNKEGGKIG